MALQPSWQFPFNETDAPIGPRDRGIEHYSGQRFNSLVRETIQNSLDAQANPGHEPARVEFSIEKLHPKDFDGDTLATAIEASIAEMKPGDDTYRRMFSKALKQLKKGTVTTLAITDTNTTGLSDEGDHEGNWGALTRGAGESNKQRNNAAGSKGIGKAAAYIATDLRTVLYSTAFLTDRGLESRFIGKSILSGHKDSSGKPRTSEGFYANTKFKSLRNGEIPPRYQINTQGLCLRIPGYEPTQHWKDDITRIAIENFFHGIIKGELEIAIEERVIHASSIGDYTHLLKNPRERHLLEVSTMEPVEATSIEAIGEVNLRIKIHDSTQDNFHETALVRDAGMMITRNRTKLGPAKFTIPSHWNSFTAIVECMSDTSDPEKKSAVRESESANHNELELDRIPNSEDRPPARKALQALGLWIKESIQKYAEPTTSLDPVNAEEAAHMLPINQRTTDSNNKPRPTGDSISEPVQRGTSAPTTRVAPGPDPESEDQDKNKPHEGDEEKHHSPPTRRSPARAQPIAQREVFARAKFRPGGRHPTHGITIQIPPLGKRVSNVQVLAVTEHGNDVLVKITEAWSNGRKLKINRSKITSIPPNGANPVTLEVNLQEPVEGRRFRIRTATTNKEAN